MAQEPDAEKSKRRKDHVIFLICVLLASLFWILIKLSGEYSVSYALQLHYLNTPKDMMITALKDSSVNINFKSDGYNILDLLLSGKLKTLDANLAHCSIHKLGKQEYSIPSQNLKEKLVRDLGISENELSFSKSELEFRMETLGEKIVKVSPQLALTFKSQHGLYSTKTIPETIHIYGPEQLIDSIKEIQTVTVRLNNLVSNQEVRALLQNPFPNQIKIIPSTVRLKLEIEKFTESSLKIPIDVSGVNLPIRTFPNTTTLYFNVFLKDYNKIHVNQFKVIPDIKNINLREVKKLGLKVIEKPNDISNERMTPTSVEFIIIN